MKKVIALLVLVMLLASSFVVCAEAVPTDTLQNELYDVVSPIIDVPSSEAASHGEVVYSEITNYPEKELVRIYQDDASADCFDVNTDWVKEETKVVLTSKK